MNGVNILDVRKYKSRYVWWVKWKTTGNLLLRKDESNFRLVHAPTSSQVNKSWRNVCRLKRSQTTLWLNVSVKLRPQFYIPPYDFHDFWLLLPYIGIPAKCLWRGLRTVQRVDFFLLVSLNFQQKVLKSILSLASSILTFKQKLSIQLCLRFWMKSRSVTCRWAIAHLVLGSHLHPWSIKPMHW